jgi:hypothetical protein
MGIPPLDPLKAGNYDFDMNESQFAVNGKLRYKVHFNFLSCMLTVKAKTVYAISISFLFFRLTFSNTVVRELSTFNVTDIKTSLLHMNVNISLDIPYFTIRGIKQLENLIVSFQCVSFNFTFHLF